MNKWHLYKACEQWALEKYGIKVSIGFEYFGIHGIIGISGSNGLNYRVDACKNKAVLYTKIKRKILRVRYILLLSQKHAFNSDPVNKAVGWTV